MTSPFDADLTPDPSAGYIVSRPNPTGPLEGVTAPEVDTSAFYTFSMYSSATGLFTGQTCSGSIALVEDMDKLDPVVSMVMGEYDHLSQRVDLDTGQIIDYVPPKPGNGFQWFADVKRWRYVSNEAESLYDAQMALKQAVNDRCTGLLTEMRNTYPPDEVTSWSKQEGEARAFTADNVAPVPLLAAIAAARGIPLSLLAQKVIEKADAFAAYSGVLIGERQHAEDRIDACTTVESVNALRAELFTAA